MTIVPASFPDILPVRIAFVGDAPGEDEVRAGFPFAGKSGRALNGMLKLAGIIRNEQLVTNVFDFKLNDNSIDGISWTKKEASDAVGRGAHVEHTPSSGASMFEDWLLSPVETGKYIKPEFAVPALERLREELELAAPNIIVPLGNTALWAVTQQTGVTSVRGSVMTAKIVPHVKVIPTYHPAAILRQWYLRIAGVQDLMKIRTESRFSHLAITDRWLVLEPTMSDMQQFKRENIDAMASDAPLSVDIETRRGQITCIGFATDPHNALCVPFVDVRKPGGNYWPTAADEAEALQFCADILEGPQPKLGQNFTYDWQWLLVKLGIKVRNYREDTRLLHHALYPEMKKDLGFLGSIYLTDRAWKGWSSGKGAKRDN
jgi:uracil-DNA glycosylase